MKRGSVVDEKGASGWIRRILFKESWRKDVGLEVRIVVENEISRQVRMRN